MTAEPISSVQLRPLTVAEYLAWPGDPERRYELQEGAIVMKVRPGIDHQDFLFELGLSAPVPVRLDLDALG